MKARARPSSCERCSGVVRRKGELWWCWACNQACEPVAPERRARRQARTYGSAERLARIHGLPCIAQGRPGHRCGPWDMDQGRAPSQAVHVRARGAGGTADDVVPGCHEMHQQAGELGTSARARFEAETGLDLVAEARRLALEWASDPLATAAI